MEGREILLRHKAGVMALEMKAPPMLDMAYTFMLSSLHLPFNIPKSEMCIEVPVGPPGASVEESGCPRSVNVWNPALRALLRGTEGCSAPGPDLDASWPQRELVSEAE